MRTTASSIALHTIIAEQSALPGGFAIDTVIETYSNNAHKICNRLASNGKLYKAKASHFLIRPYHFESADYTHSSVEFEVCGELPNGQWVNLQVYSVNMTDALKTIEPAKKVLQAAWNAAWESA